MPIAIVLLTPGFSPVDTACIKPRPFQPLLHARGKPLKRLRPAHVVVTGLKPGVNERSNFAASWIRKSMLILALVCSLSAARAANPPEFERANQLYDQGKFADAKQIYKSLAKAGDLSANLFYNLGNTEFRLGGK